MVAARQPAMPAWSGQPDPLSFPALVRAMRTRNGWSQNQLARAAGVDPAYINRIERQDKDHAPPSRRVVLAIWDALETTEADRERLLVAAGYCPEIIRTAGGWDPYRQRIRQNVADALAVLDHVDWDGGIEVLRP
jgi:transcriptional regulator with XRE-family HTH domain